MNNAGYLGNTLSYNVDGIEQHFATNVLAVWRLTHALLPALRKKRADAGDAEAARVVNVTAGEKTASPVDGSNLLAEKGHKGLMTMTHSKATMECMSLAL